MASRTDDDSGRRQVLIGLGALVVVTLLVGGIVSLMALGAARLSGLGESSSAGGPAVPPSLYIPPGEPSTSPEVYPDPTRPDREEPSEAPSETEPTELPTAQSKKITLQAFPLEASPGERITMTGVYPAGEGATLQVQRLEGGTWSDFPVAATVNGGIYNTYILTSRTGETRFRVTDKALGRSSNPVTVTIR